MSFYSRKPEQNTATSFITVPSCLPKKTAFSLISITSIPGLSSQNFPTIRLRRSCSNTDSHLTGLSGRLSLQSAIWGYSSSCLSMGLILSSKTLYITSASRFHKNKRGRCTGRTRFSRTSFSFQEPGITSAFLQVLQTRENVPVTWAPVPQASHTGL